MDSPECVCEEIHRVWQSWTNTQMGFMKEFPDEIREWIPSNTLWRKSQMKFLDESLERIPGGLSIGNAQLGFLK